MTTPFAFGASVTGDQRTLTVTGELDMAVSRRFEQVLVATVAATPPGGELTVDLSEVRFFDVTALRALLRAADATQAARVPLRLATSPVVDRVFNLLGIETAPVQACPTSTPTRPCSWITIPPGAGTRLHRSRALALETVVERLGTVVEGGCVGETPHAAQVQRAAGILTEREQITPREALERMQARAARDGTTVATLGRRIGEHRGWPPARC